MTERRSRAPLPSPAAANAVPGERTNTAPLSGDDSPTRVSGPQPTSLAQGAVSEQPGIEQPGIEQPANEAPNDKPRASAPADPDFKNKKTELDLDELNRVNGSVEAAPDSMGITGQPTELALEVGPVSKGSRQTVHLRKVTAKPEDEADEVDSPKRAESYVGYVIDGRYHVETVLAQGGMGVVYRGRHRLIDKAVAIKVLRPELADNREITQRFLTEAQAASSIGNEHIVDITDYGELPDGATYIVMEYLEGQALGQALAKDEAMPVEDILDIARQVCDGLQHAHEAGIVHRDLKPDNIFLTHRGKQERFVKILDFGIAKVASSQNQLTRAGRIFGTPHYMSPEQARGEELDNRADVYSMGVILYEMLSGKLPFEGENPLGILTQHMYNEPRPLHELCGITRVSVGLEAIVSKCLLKEPWQRYSSMAELGSDIERLKHGEEPIAIADLRRLSVAPASLKQRLSRGIRRNRSRAWLWLVLLAGAVGGLTYAIPRRTELLALWHRYVPQLSESAALVPEEPGLGLRSVALVLSPIDAHVFRGKQDLGQMPITVRIRDGQRVRLSVQRDGYVTQQIDLDGSEDRKVVELSPLPGAAPAAAKPVHPAGNANPRFVTIDEDGANHSPAPPEVIKAPDAGTHKAKKVHAAPSPSLRTSDAGARKHSRRRAAPPPLVNDILAPLPPLPEEPPRPPEQPTPEPPAPGPPAQSQTPQAPSPNPSARGGWFAE
jgi:serine/threonine-protein kinase